MKSAVLALMALLAMSGIASARTNWQGEVMVLAVTGCEAGGDNVGDSYVGLFQPENNATITDNSTSNFLSFVGRRNGTSLKFSSLTAGVAYTGVQISGRGHHTTTSGTIASISTAPATVSSTTPTLVINAKINNWFNTLGCTATIRGAFVKRVDAP
jgi:hypothetical protein